MPVTEEQIAALEAQVATLLKPPKSVLTNIPHRVVRNLDARAALARQEDARLARQRAAEAAAAQVRQEAERNAPKQARRDREIAALSEKINEAIVAEGAAKQRVADLVKQRADLAGMPL